MRARTRSIRQQLGWLLVLSVSAIMVVVYMTMYQVQKDRLSRLMRDIPQSADEVLHALKGNVPDDIIVKLQTWATKVEEQTPAQPQIDPWEEEQNKRKEFIRKVCYEVREAAEVKKPSPQDMLQYMTLDNVDNVIFCPSLESNRATDWQKVLEQYAERALRLEKYARGEERWEEASDEYEREMEEEEDLIEEDRQRERTKFREVINAQSVQEVLGSYYMKANTKVLLVEHPFERLLSFYLETIRDKVGKTGEQISKKIINQNYKHETNKEKKTKQVSFPQFINYLLFRVAYDPHLKALYYVCHPCDIQYDYIIKMETFHTDVQNINERIRAKFAQENKDDPDALPLPERREFPFFNLTDEAWIQDMLYTKYSKIRSDNLLKAFDLFSIDIFLFNYSWPFENLSLTSNKRRH